MTDLTKGLRFDVYERIHLPDEVAAIDELEEIELVPRIQVIEQGDHAVLKGQLLLSGVYRAPNDAAVLQTLEHWIPVEITLPLNRISRLDDISVEIDNFDVDLLSSRTLNITGVLSLRGILVEPLPEAVEAWREESITVVHQREAVSGIDQSDEGQELDEAEEFIAESSRQAEPSQPFFAGSTGQLPSYEQDEDEPSAELEEEAEPEAAVTISASPRDGGWSASQWFTQNTPQQEPVREILQEEPEEATYSSQEVIEESWSAEQYDEPQRYPEPTDEEIEAITSAVWQEVEQQRQREREYELEQEAQWHIESEAQTDPEVEKPEVRIGLSSKQPEAEGNQAANVGLLTLLQTSKREQAARHAAEQIAAEEAEQLTKSQATSGDEIEWKNLFLGKRSDEQEFRKIRVCIVQRDETLETIAVRYSLNPREILLYNSLNEASIEEGQLLYIP